MHNQPEDTLALLLLATVATIGVAILAAIILFGRSP
jgi:hypothetical protein